MVAVLALTLSPTLAVALVACGAVLGVVIGLLGSRRNHGDGGAVRESMPSFRYSLAKIEVELARVRRYDHTLSIMVVHVPAVEIDRQHVDVFAGALSAARARHLQRIVALHVGAILYDCLRSCDLPTWDAEHDRYIVILPESDRARAGLAADRLRRLVPAHVGTSVAVGVAEFPSDGLALDDLVAVAAERCAARPEAETDATHAVPRGAAAPDMVESNVVERNSMDRQAQSG